MENKKYELMVIYTPQLAENEVKEQLEVLKNKIKDLEGKVLNEDFWGLKKLSYEIKKQTQGYYDVMVVEMSPSKANDLSAWLKLQDQYYLRSLLSIVDE